jgi:hypothetical protein
MSPDDYIDKMWVWMDFVKPGKNCFTVKIPGGYDPEKSKPYYFVHKFVGNVRTEDIPNCKLNCQPNPASILDYLKSADQQNPDEENQISRPEQPTLFAGRAIDTSELNSQLFKHDFGQIRWD